MRFAVHMQAVVDMQAVMVEGVKAAVHAGCG